MNNNNNNFLSILARIYFRIESYDEFNYSAPPWTTLLMIFDMLGCFITLPLALYKYLAGCKYVWLNENSLKPFLLCFWGAVVSISTLLSIIMEIDGRKKYKRMELYAGGDFLKQLEEKRDQRSFFLEVFVYINLFFAPILINTLSIVFLCLY